LQNPLTLRNPKEFCESDKHSHSMIDKDNNVQHVKNEGPSERPSTSSSNPKRSIFVHSFDLNVPYDENDDNQ